MITFKDVTKTYGDNIGLYRANIHIGTGDFVFLVGPSGAGKTTFMNLIIKDLNPDSGTIIVDGKDVTKLSQREIPELRRKIGIVFQDFKLLPQKTVFENVAFAMEVVHSTQRAIRRQVPQVLKLMGILDKADSFPSQLSAGQQQRVAIARAIVNNPKILIADEPTGNIDFDTKMAIMDLINIINSRGTTVLIVTHDNVLVDAMKKRVINIESGRIVKDSFSRQPGINAGEASEGDSGSYV